MSVLAPSRRHRQLRLVDSGKRVRRREHMGEHVVGDGKRVADRGHDATERRSALRRPTPAGRRPPAPPSRTGRRCPAPAGRDVRRRAGPAPDRRRARASTAIGSASRSSSRRMRLTAGARSRQSSSRSTHTHVEPAGFRRRRRAPRSRRRGRAGRASDAAVAVVTGVLDARNRPRARGTRARRTGRTARARRGRRRQNHWSASPAARSCRFARSADGEAANTSRTVSLNWRTLPKPAAKAIAVNGMSVVSMRMRAVWRALGAGDGERARAELVADDPVQVALAVGSRLASPPTPSRSTTPSATRRIALATTSLANVPLGRAGRRVGPAALARPVAVVVGGGRGREELDVVPLRGHRRAARPAVDAGGAHGGEEHAVEAGVATADGPVARLVVQPIVGCPAMCFMDPMMPARGRRRRAEIGHVRAAVSGHQPTADLRLGHPTRSTATATDRRCTAFRPMTTPRTGATSP